MASMRLRERGSMVWLACEYYANLLDAEGDKAKIKSAQDDLWSGLINRCHKQSHKGVLHAADPTAMQRAVKAWKFITRH